jgi:peptidoglycan/LPS O-acetylase OafA/YrhL
VFFVVLACGVLPQLVLGQPVQSIATPQINVTTGVVWFLLVLLFALAYGIPIACWLYRIIIRKLVEKASKKIETWSMRLSERFSAAGRKLSETMRA